MTDAFTSYETGLTELLERLGKDHPRYTEVLTLQSRLLENVSQARQYSDTETRRAERAQTVDALNRLALETVEVSFNELCGVAPDEPTTEKHPTRIPQRAWGFLAVLFLDFCLLILWGWCLFGDQPNLIAYLGTVAAIIALFLTILTIILRMGRPIVLEEALLYLGTDQRCIYVTLGLTGLIIVVTTLFWPLGWLGNCKQAPTPIPPLSKTSGHEVYVPAGEFWMGSDDEKLAKPRRRESVDGFWIDKYEVTNAEYKKFVDAEDHRVPYTAGAEGSNWDRELHMYPPDKANHPVVLVSWYDAKAYCEWKGKRLPTEAEWEKAARGTDGRRYPWGDDWPSSDAPKANTRGVRGDTARVGAFEEGASPYRVMGMAGNVSEWVADNWDKPWTEEDYKTVRGGSWDAPGRSETRNSDGSAGVSYGYVTTTYRWPAAPDDRSVFRGFRCARDAAP